MRTMPVPAAHDRRAICFVDMAGFTALTETQGDEDAAQIATDFAKLARGALGVGDRLVKTIGDAVMVTSPSADTAVAFVERLLTRAAGLPALRAGMHFGQVVEREDDVFGAAVNLAARVAAEAHAGEVLGTRAIAEAAERRKIGAIDLGSVMLKNVSDAVPLYSLALVLGASETPIDPVCQNPVDRRSAAGHLKYSGNEFWFCSLTCAAAFASNPAWHGGGRVKLA